MWWVIVYRCTDNPICNPSVLANGSVELAQSLLVFLNKKNLLIDSIVNQLKTYLSALIGMS